MVSICTLRVRLFLKSFSPKPACLVATKNKIFRISSSCWPKFTPLTRKWIYTLIFTSIHFWKKGERERERERESPDRRAPIDERRDRPTRALVDRRAVWSSNERARRSSLLVDRRDRDRPRRRSSSGAIAISTIAVRSRRPSFWVCLVCLFFLLLQTPENIFQKIFWNVTKHMKIFSFPENSISEKWNIFRKCFYANQTQP